MTVRVVSDKPVKTKRATRARCPAPAPRARTGRRRLRVHLLPAPGVPTRGRGRADHHRELAVSDRAQTGGVVAFVTHGSVDDTSDDIDQHLVGVRVFPRADVRGAWLKTNEEDDTLVIAVVLATEDETHLLNLQMLSRKITDEDDYQIRDMVADLVCGEFDGDVVWVGRARLDNSRRDWVRRANVRVSHEDLAPTRSAWRT